MNGKFDFEGCIAKLNQCLYELSELPTFTKHQIDMACRMQDNLMFVINRMLEEERKSEN